MSFTSLVRFIPIYFVLFDVKVNGIISLISLSDSSLVMYGNATNFCILILYPETLLNLLMNCSSFLCSAQDFLCIISYHLQVVTLTPSFPIWIPFLSFSCLIAMAVRYPLDMFKILLVLQPWKFIHIRNYLLRGAWSPLDSYTA